MAAAGRCCGLRGLRGGLNFRLGTATSPSFAAHAVPITVELAGIARVTTVNRSGTSGAGELAVRGRAATTGAEPGPGKPMDGQMARTRVMASRSADVTQRPYFPLTATCLATYVHR